MSSPLVFRSAGEADIPAIIGMLADDELGRSRNPPFEVAKQRYLDAFAQIASDPNNDLVVVVRDDEIVGTLQITFIPGLSYTGGERAQIEGVRVSSAERGTGIGRQLIDHAVGLAKARGCILVQLTTDLRRADAARFYEGLGFKSSHRGMKLWL